MTKRRPTIITMHTLKLAYILGRKSTKKIKVHSAYAGKMDEGEFNRCMEILNENKNGLQK